MIAVIGPVAFLVWFFSIWMVVMLCGDHPAGRFWFWSWNPNMQLKVALVVSIALVIIIPIVFFILYKC